MKLLCLNVPDGNSIAKASFEYATLGPMHIDLELKSDNESMNFYTKLVKSSHSCQISHFQAILFIAAVLGSGAIFLMIVGAVQLALRGAISNWASFTINLIPIILFVIICFKAKSSTQVNLHIIPCYILLDMIYHPFLEVYFFCNFCVILCSVKF